MESIEAKLHVWKVYLQLRWAPHGPAFYTVNSFLWWAPYGPIQMLSEYCHPYRKCRFFMINSICCRYFAKVWAYTLFSNFNRQKSITNKYSSKSLRGRLDDTGINITFYGGICPLQQDFFAYSFIQSLVLNLLTMWMRLIDFKFLGRWAVITSNCGSNERIRFALRGSSWCQSSRELRMGREPSKVILISSS